MLEKIRPSISKTDIVIIYKLLADLLFILLVAFVLAMLAERALPGIVASHIGLSKFALLILANVLALSLAAKLAGIRPGKALDKKIGWAISILAAFLIFLSLFKLNIYLNLFILAFVIVSGYFTLKIMEE